MEHEKALCGRSNQNLILKILFSSFPVAIARITWRTWVYKVWQSHDQNFHSFIRCLATFHYEQNICSFQICSSKLFPTYIYFLPTVNPTCEKTRWKRIKRQLSEPPRFEGNFSCQNNFLLRAPVIVVINI